MKVGTVEAEGRLTPTVKESFEYLLRFWLTARLFGGEVLLLTTQLYHGTPCYLMRPAGVTNIFISPSQ